MGFLTGITPTGALHLGNYVGTMRPALAVSRRPGTEALYFPTDYHALVKCADLEVLTRTRFEFAAS